MFERIAGRRSTLNGGLTGRAAIAAAISGSRRVSTSMRASVASRPAAALLRCGHRTSSRSPPARSPSSSPRRGRPTCSSALHGRAVVVVDTADGTVLSPLGSLPVVVVALSAAADPYADPRCAAADVVVGHGATGALTDLLARDRGDTDRLDVDGRPAARRRASRGGRRTRRRVRRVLRAAGGSGVPVLAGLAAASRA